MPAYTPRRGREVIEEAAERKGGGDFKPFCPELRWSQDGDEKYVLVLTDLEEGVVEALVHEWIKVGTFENRNGETKPKYEWFLSRKDRGIGETHDELERKGSQPKLRIMGVGVELEPVVEPGRGGRQTVVGFEVATSTYNRKGEDDETEEVTQPNIGVISQSSGNFWKPLSAFEDQMPVNETAFQIKRQGKDASTSYAFIHFMGQDIDLSNLIEYIDGVTYLSQDEEEFNDLLGAIEASKDDQEAAEHIAEALLMARLNELADKERYDELTSDIDSIESKFGKKKSGKPAEKKERPARRTRRAAQTEEPQAEAQESAPEAAPEAPAEEKKSSRGDRFAKLRERTQKSE